jgi:hypothetical protein
MSHIALYKTFEQLVYETYKVGDVYTYPFNNQTQITEIKKLPNGDFVVEYMIKGDHSTRNSSMFVRTFISFLKAHPASVYIGNQPLWG